MYHVSYVQTLEQLRQVLDFCYGILGDNLRNIDNYRWEDWTGRLEKDNRLLVYAYEDGNIISAVLGRRENPESLVCGFVACARGYRRQGITKGLMDRFEKEAVRAGFRYITLGSGADGFYEKCGYKVIREINGQRIYQKSLEDTAGRIRS